jgi:hypothetical protein
MVGHELAIKQFKPANSKPCNQPCHSNLRRVCFPRKHTFAKKCATQGEPIQPANKSAPQPAFYAVGMALLVQSAESLFDIGINPSVPSVHARFGTSSNDLRKSGVSSNDKPVLPDSFGKRL